jgi:hypothetical protein
MRSLAYKLLAYPAAVAATDWLLPEVSFRTWQHAILTGAILAVLLHLADVALLPAVRPLRMAMVDGGLASLMLIFGANWMAGLQFHSGGALLTGLLIGLTAYAINIDAAVKAHSWR